MEQVSEVLNNINSTLANINTPDITDWLMLGVTTVYALITILIFRSNKQSADAAMKQLEEEKKQLLSSQKQQNQNAGIALYEMRKKVLTSIIDDNEIHKTLIDVEMLFDSNIVETYRKHLEALSEYEVCSYKVCDFQNHLREYEPDEYDEYCRLESEADQHNDYECFYSFLDKHNSPSGNGLYLQQQLDATNTKKINTKEKLVSEIKDYIRYTINQTE